MGRAKLRDGTECTLHNARIPNKISGYQAPWDDITKNAYAYCPNPEAEKGLEFIGFRA